MPSNYITVPVIPYGLRQEETIIQIASSLKSLEQITANVFEQIEDNIKRHKEYLSELQRRSEVVAAKVDQLAGKNVATTVFSYNKFPVKENTFNTLFEMKLTKASANEYTAAVQSRHPHAKYNKSANKPHFYHVKSATAAQDEQYQQMVTEQGLGEIPPDVEDVSSLLLFNTSENLYKKYVMLDPLSIDGQDFERDMVNESAVQKDSIAAAPNSIINNYLIQNNEYFNSFYTPAYHEIPSINVPADLPDLPGIADNLKFNANQETSIAPSKQTVQREKETDAVKDTVDAKPISQSSIEKSVLPQSTVSNTTSVSDMTNLTSTAPGPPPPPPLPVQEVASPPPPPPPLPTEIEETETPAEKPPKREITPQTDVHANLMEAIRNAGGKGRAKLRPVVQKSDGDGESVAKVGESDTFMGELYKKLALRRDGISPGQNKDRSKQLGMFDRLSSKIPVLSEDDSDSNGSSVDDWD